MAKKREEPAAAPLQAASAESTGPGAERAAPDELQLVTFFLGNEEFGAPIAFVKEIVRVPEITRIPKAPEYVQGIANLRGSILPVVSLRTRFDLPEAERTDDNRVVVVEIDGRLTGLEVDRVSEVMRVPADCVEPPPPVVTASLDASYLRGVAKLHNGERLTILLDVERVVPSQEVSDQVRRASAAGTSDVEARASRGAVATEQMVSFLVENEEYAVSITDVQEIIRVPEVSKLPRTPVFIDGVVALRNRLLPIVNLRARFGLAGFEGDPDERRIIVLNMGGVITGVLVDAVAEVLSVPLDAVEPPPAIVAAADGDRLRGVAKLDEGRRLVMLLDVARLLSASEVGELEALAEGAGPDGADAVADRGRRAAIDEEQFVGFRIDDEEFGIGIQQVQEIINLAEITRVPRAPYFVEGIINLRGSVLPVIDLRKRFALAEVEATDSTSIVIVDAAGVKTGIIVDAMSGVLRVSRDEIELPPTVVTGRVDASFVRGVGKLQGGQRMLIVLDVDQVLAGEGHGALAA
ncbi:MAG TPA: chemotaxis protein CheW [Gemmatimonadaceae bacterium]|nr:chemotaxis protein CheW [Gemmatimonadaceae bacterium]